MKKESSPRPRVRVSPPQSSTTDRISIVGIGASAGGLEALQKLLKVLAPDTGMAFVIVSHLDPQRASSLTEILTRSTSMPVGEARNGVGVEPNSVYVISPGIDLTIENGRLRCSRRPVSKLPQHPIDLFFRSLANDCGRRAIGVILSGTGNDGTLGLKAIAEAGGLTFAQDASATHHGMPDSAVAEECVDFVLPPQDIAAELRRIALNPAWNERETFVPPPASSDSRPDPFIAILKALTSSTGIDFIRYKHPTLRRRIDRRMVLRQLTSWDVYLECLRSDPAEMRALHQEMLIQVTSFFRDPEVFDSIKADILPRLLENPTAKSGLRIWVPGCATGEEAYSLAICVLEAMQERGVSHPVKIFATDVSDSAINRARTGHFSKGIAAVVSPSRLREFFVVTDQGYQVQKRVRDLCVFARQDVTRDPPFSQLDLVSCRNLLIYLGEALQAGVIPLFHYALRPAGILLLGNAESIGKFSDLFSAIDKKLRLFQKTNTFSQIRIERSPIPSHQISDGILEMRSDSSPRLQDFQREADRVILSRFAPPGVVIDDNLNVLQFRGQTGEYLQPAPGMPTTQLLQLAREGLLPDLQAVIEEAKASGLPARRNGVRVKRNGQFDALNLEVIPITVPLSLQRCFVVLFEPSIDRGEIGSPRGRSRSTSEQRATEDDPPPEASEHHEQALASMSHELAATKDYLQSVIEAKEAANEELKAANEEIVSSYEEVQSANEELETAKEEMQATNEELATMNDELHARIRVATQLNDDLTNLVESVNIPIVMLSQELKLRRFSPSAERILNLRPADVGRHINEFRPRISVPDLTPHIDTVLDTLQSAEYEVTDNEGRWFKMCIRPYRTAENKIDGATLSFLDIDALKRKEQQLQAARDFARTIVDGLQEALLVLDDRMRVMFANRPFYEQFETSPSETEGELVYAIRQGQLNSAPLRKLLDSVVAANDIVRDFRIEIDMPGRGPRTLLVNSQVADRTGSDGQPRMILVSMTDVTEREFAERLKVVVDSAADAILCFDEHGVITAFNRAAELMFGYRAAEVIGQPLKIVLPRIPDLEFDGSQAGGIGEVECRSVFGRRHDASPFPVDMAMSKAATTDGPLFTAILRDTSERRALERQFLDIVVEEQRRIGQDLHDTAGQVLIGLNYMAHGLTEELQAKGLPEAKSAERISSELERTLEQIQRIAKGLVPVEVDSEGLRAALSQLVDRTGTGSNVTCTFNCQHPVHLDDNQTATQLYWIAQEAITNALRHAGPSELRVSLESEHELLKMEIWNNGKKYVAEPGGAGLGLKIMRYRAGLIGATLLVSSRDDGTCVSCAVRGKFGHDRGNRKKRATKGQGRNRR